MPDLAIETRDLTRRYGAQLAVDSLSLQVPQQAVFGFLGPNGAGKSTTIRMLLGLLRPTGGQALIQGLDISRDRIGAARLVGALLEAHGLYANLTGRENLELACTLRGLDRTEIDRVLDLTDMAASAGRRVSDYSLGMRQRLGLARALMGSPPVLILDEPTNGLDPDGIADMRGFLAELPERTGATVLVSSHLLSEVEQIASHVGILYRGRLQRQGRLSDLLDAQPQEIDLATSDDAAALSLLHGRGLGVTSHGAGLCLHLAPGDAPRPIVAAVNRALMEAGLEVYHLAPRPRSLEALYRQAKTDHPEAA